MSSNTIRWGILGAGIIARKLADAVARDPGSELVAVASRTPDKAAAFAGEFGIAADSYEGLVGRADVDVVYVATTHNLHYEGVKLALEHDKPVLVEKPFTVNAGEAAALIELARQRDLFLMEAIWTRFLPSLVELRRRLLAGEIGQVRHLTLSFGGFVPPHFANRLKDPALAGGVTLDMGIYPISFACYMLGERPAEVTSQATFSDTGVDERASYLFRFPSGATAAISTSYNLKMKQEALLYGTTGYAEFTNFQAGDRFVLHRHDGGNEILASRTLSEPIDDNGFVYQVAEVARCLRAGERESPVIPLDETLGIMRLMDGLRADWGFRYPFE